MSPAVCVILRFVGQAVDTLISNKGLGKEVRECSPSWFRLGGLHSTEVAFTLLTQHSWVCIF